MKVNTEIIVPYDDINFTAEAVSMLPKEVWVAQESKRTFTSIPAATQKEKLETVHDLCTEACEKAGIKVVMLPASVAQGKKKSKKAAGEESPQE